MGDNDIEAARGQLQSGTNSQPATTTQPLSPTDLTGKRKIHLQLYQAALDGNWDVAKDLYEKHQNEIKYNAEITGRKETALHIAAAAENVSFVEQLVQKMYDKDLALPNKAGNTAFCLAAVSGKVELAKAMMNKNKDLVMDEDLVMTRGRGGMLPINMAAVMGHRKMVRCLYDATKAKLEDSDKKELFFTLINSDIYDVALEMLRADKKLATARDKNKETALHALAQKSSMPTNITHQKLPGLWNKCIHFFAASEQALERSQMHRAAIELVQCIWNEVVLLEDSEISTLIGSPSRLIFTAAEKGNVEFLTILIRSYPDLIFKVDDNTYSIFHIAVLHRHEDIFKLIHEIGSIKNLIATYTDGEGNNMLHLAAKLPLTETRLHVVPGAALQLQRELLWFEEVKNVVLPQQVEAANNAKPQEVEAAKNANVVQTQRVEAAKNHSVVQPRAKAANNANVVQPQQVGAANKGGLTPGALLMENHKKLMKEGEEWMRGTANSCMVVATLIATVVFAAGFTVPGGNDQNNGIPIFLKKIPFKVFAVSNALSLISSVSSVLTFLSIMTSRYAIDDFYWSLPNKLIIGLATLFISIAAMLVAFIAALFLVFNHGQRLIWFAIPIAVIASLPVIMFVQQHYRLFMDVMKSTYLSKSIFKPNKSPLFSARVGDKKNE